MKIEILWFEDCPNYRAAISMVEEVLDDLGITTNITLVEVPDETTGRRVQFPGSPTIRVDGVDVEPGFAGCDDCTPRCRLYATGQGLRGLPERAWVRETLAAAG